MKKSILLIICMLVALCGCGKKGPTDYKVEIGNEEKLEDILQTEVASNGDSYSISKCTMYSTGVPGKYNIVENIDGDSYYYSKETTYPNEAYEYKYFIKKYQKYEVTVSDFKTHKKVKTIDVKKIFDERNKDEKFQLMNNWNTTKMCYKDGKYYLVFAIQKVPTKKQMKMNQKEAEEDVNKEYLVYDFYIDLKTEEGTIDTKPSSNMSMGLTYEDSLGYLEATDIFNKNVTDAHPDIGINPYLKDSPKDDKIILLFKLNNLGKVDKSAKIFKIFPNLLKSIKKYKNNDNARIYIYLKRMNDTDLVGLFTPEGKQVETNNLKTYNYCKEDDKVVNSREELQNYLYDKNTWGWYNNSFLTRY